MDGPIELVPLVCLRCSTPLPAEPDEVAWVCAQCGQGMFLDSQKGLLPLEVNYLANIQPGTLGKPCWVVEGQVRVTRQTYGSSQQEREASEFWRQPRLFFIPAYNLPLEALLDVATKLLVQSPALPAGQAVRFAPVTLAVEDVVPVAEFVVMAVEAARKDKLKKLDFTLQTSTPRLWILP